MALAINEEFNPWSGNISPDGIWRIAGTWFGTGNNELSPSRATLTETYPGETSTGFLSLTIAPGSNPLRGAEIQTLDGYGYGTYEVRMKPSDVSGGVASFFLIGAPDYRAPEFDIEFLLNADNQVTFTNHPGSGTTYYNLGFDPTAAFHTYGIIWTPNANGTATVADTVDGVIVRSETSANFVVGPDGQFIMMNAWSGNANFGGGPPTQNSTTVYDWVHFTPWDGGTPPPSAGTVSINDVSISEGNSGTKLETFTVTRSGGTAAFDVSYTTSNGIATVADGDYVAASNTLHFGVNQNTQTISVTINGDTKVEANETFNVVLSNATSGATISDSQGVGTITNDDGGVIAGSVSINDVTISEGNSGTKVATFTATRSGGTAAFDLNFATSEGTATVADSDYVAASNTLHFGVNQNTQTISVTINGDTKVEANETFNVVLSNATSGATISDSQGVGTITNDDGGVIAGSVSINDVTISEGDSGTKVATFTATRSGGTAAFDVTYATFNGTATVADSDYVAASSTLHFGANENTQTISVAINGDTKVEANETFNVVLSNATNGATISDSQGVGTITNDDGAATSNLVVNGGFESGNFSGWTLSGNSGGNQVYIAPTDFPGEVHTGSYSAGLGSMNRTDGILTQNIATTAEQHYTLSFWIESDNNGSTPINHFAAEWNGQTLMAITDAPNSGYQLYTFDVVGINGNSILEFNGYNSPDAWRLDDVTLTAVGVAPPAVAGSISVNDVTISEGNSGTKVATFTVTRSEGTAAFDVNYATSDGTATVTDSDYVAGSGTLNFGANQNTQTISVTINSDTKVEANETFNVDLANATNGAIISDSQGVGSITNDDVGVIAGSVSINDATISEGDSGTEVATFTVTRSGGTAAFDVNFATSNGTATVADSDYVAASNTLHFGASENTQTISVTINGDTTVEADETFDVVLSNATNGAAISDSQGVGTITNDDGAVIVGSDSNDILTGGGGNDVLDGRGGIDTLFGGAGGDTFVFGDKIQADGDTVMDFVHGVDQLDFHLIDAREFRSGDQAFIFDGYSVGDHPSTRLWLTEDQAANVTHVYADTGPTVFRVDLTGTNLGLTASDFIL